MKDDNRVNSLLRDIFATSSCSLLYIETLFEEHIFYNNIYFVVRLYPSLRSRRLKVMGAGKTTGQERTCASPSRAPVLSCAHYGYFQAPYFSLFWVSYCMRKEFDKRKILFKERIMFIERNNSWQVPDHVTWNEIKRIKNKQAIKRTKQTNKKQKQSKKRQRILM